MPIPPILEFDSDRTAVIEPHFFARSKDLPPHCVLCFFWEAIEKYKTQHSYQSMRPIRSEMPDIPICVFRVQNKPIAVAPMAVGAPLAVAILEELIARGATHFIACGGAGVLDATIACGDVFVPTSALREEGTSYHYLPSNRDANPSLEAVDAIRRTLGKNGCFFQEGKTWTTDAIYRETKGKIQRRKQQGCRTVEMETAALFAVAEFRDVHLAQILYGGDCVVGENWDSRNWRKQSITRERLLSFAVEACQSLVPSQS